MLFYIYLEHVVDLSDATLSNTKIKDINTLNVTKPEGERMTFDGSG